MSQIGYDPEMSNGGQGYEIPIQAPTKLKIDHGKWGIGEIEKSTIGDFRTIVIEGEEYTAEPGKNAPLVHAVLLLVNAIEKLGKQK